jgi:uncharacterized protein YjbI with pentapeptide repeats
MSEDSTCSFTVAKEEYERRGGKGHKWDETLELLGAEEESWQCPYESEKDSTRCALHLPSEKVPDGIDKSLRVINIIESRDVPNHFLFIKVESLDLTDIEAAYGPIIFIGCDFSGTIEAEGESTPPLYCVFCDFQEDADFSNTKFSGAVDFRRTNFYERAEFSSAVFEGETIFSGVNFDEGTSFQDTVFSSRADFQSTEFSNNCFFARAEFHDWTPFRNADLGAASFQNATFDCGHATFYGSDFRHANFTDAEFKGDATFRYTSFKEKNSRFIDICFQSEVDFKGAEFNGSVLFVGSEFNEESVFSYCDFKDSVKFSSEDRVCTFDKPPQFNESDLSGADFDGVTLCGGDFGGSNLTDASLSESNLQKGEFEGALLSRATLFGADLSGAKLNGTVLGDVRIDEDTQFLGHSSDDSDSSPHTLSAIRSQPKCVYDPDYEEDNEHADVDKAKSVYRALEELGGKHARPRLQARSFVRRQDLQKDEYKQDAKEAESWEERFIAGARWSRARVARTTLLYGESPWRVIGWSLGIIFSFALLYPLGGWMKPADGGPITYAQIASNPVEILNSVYYSTLTYTALGFGDFQPVGFGRLLTTLETGFGAVMLALLVFILGRRAAR